jgi:CHAT domain-containing protein
MRTIRRFAIVMWLCSAFSLSAATLSADGSAPRDSFAACRQRFAEKPEDFESSYCFYQAAVNDGLWKEGARVFEQLMRQHSENDWLPLAYGYLYRDRDHARAEALYRRAADGFQKKGNAAGEILARSTLRHYLFPKGRLTDAAREVDRVSALAASVADPLLKAQAWTLQASHLQDTGGDLGHAYRLLKQSERAIFPDGPYRLRRACLNALGVLAFRLGRIAEALATYERVERLAAAEGDTRSLALTRYNILNVAAMSESMLPTAGAKQRLMSLARRSLEAGVTAQQPLVTLKTHATLAALLANDDRTEALRHAKQCVALAIDTREPHDEAVCSWFEASLLAVIAPRALQDIGAAERRALDATARASSLDTQAYSAGRHMRLSWETKGRPEAVHDSLAAIDAIETLRGLQDDDETSAELFSPLTLDYYWLAGRLLKDLQPGDLELAFTINERLRARSLLDRLERSRNRLPPTHPAVAARRSLFETIAQVQRRLMGPAVTGNERRKALHDLEDLERRADEAQRQIALASNTKSTRPAFASLDDVQSALGGNEALLSFQVGIWETYEGEFGGGSWLIAVTRSGRSVHRIPDRAQLAPLVPVFTGLLARNDGSEMPAATRLYDEILADALKALPPEIDRLILVPDGPLHRLPFDALRGGDQRLPLAARYELVIAPSATLWTHWRANAPRAAGRRALAFADPDLSVGNSQRAEERNAVLEQGTQFGRLPDARRESRALVRYLGDVDALTGKRASEYALKDRNLRDYDIIHFAAHAIADETRPDRSAVLLSPGAEKEDGLLQAREIEGLDFNGRIVVLSACRTASGAVLSGEGVLSLARAFFEAGAQAVIGTRWPIRDEDAAAIFDSFYRELGSGASLSAALGRAKTDAMNAGRPPTAWAGVELLGDGGYRPFRGERRDTSIALSFFVPLALGLVLTMAVTVRGLILIGKLVNR